MILADVINLTPRLSGLGAFRRLFNVTRPANDPLNALGVPTGFRPLDLNAVITYSDSSRLHRGPICSRSIQKKMIQPTITAGG